MRIAQSQVVNVTIIDIGNQVPAQKHICSTNGIRNLTRAIVSGLFRLMECTISKIFGIVDGPFHIFDIGKTKTFCLFIEQFIRKQELEHTIGVRYNRFRRFHQVVNTSKLRIHKTRTTVFYGHTNGFHVFHGIMQRLRFSVIVSLNLFATNSLQKLHLFLGFDTFS